VALLDGNGEVLALNFGNVELELRGLARAITTGKGSSTVGGGSNDLIERAEFLEGLGVTEGHEDDSVMGEEGEGSEGSGLNATMLGGSAGEDTSELGVEGTTLPELACGVQEGLPLGGPHTITGGDAEEEAVILGELGGSDVGVVSLGGSVHLAQDLLGQGLRDLVNIHSHSINLLDSFSNSLSQLSLVAPGRVVDDGELDHGE